MTVNLFLVLLFETKYYLRRHDALVGVAEMQLVVHRERRRVFKKMGRYGFVINEVLHVVTLLVDPQSG